MKSILLPVDQSEQMPSALESAWHLANLFESTVEGVALRPAFAEIVAPDPIVAVTIPPADWNEAEFNRSDFGITHSLPFVSNRVRVVIQVEGYR